MKVRTGPCPACGGPVEFRISSSLVTICPFCNSAVARGDKALADYGKVADLVETPSPLQLGLRGIYDGKSFEIVGHAQYRHPAGGIWDEWYAAFPNGKWGWIAEAQGKVYISFERKVAGDNPLPTFEAVDVGKRFDIGGIPLTAVEKNRASVGGAEGEMPFSLRAGESHTFVDLEGPQATFATFDYSDESPTLFLGKQVTWDDLGVGAAVRDREQPERRVQGLQLNCPQCAGTLSLHAPDETQRVVCPSCRALLDCSQGKLEYFSTLRKRKIDPQIPIGTTGRLHGTNYTVIGFMRRYVISEGQKYYWTEYLLYGGRQGFRWLVNSDEHWSFVEPASAGEVENNDNYLSYKGASFRLFQRGTAHVDYVLGEFYWKVKIEDQTHTSDFISPPRMLSIEVTPGEGSEINYSLGTYQPHDDLETAFGIKDLPRPWGISPNQPGPDVIGYWKSWALFAAAVLAIDFLASLFRKVDQWNLWYGMLFLTLFPLGVLVYRGIFETQRWSNSDYSPFHSFGGDDDE